MSGNDYQMFDRIGGGKDDFYHKSKDGLCKGGIVKTIDDEGNIKLRCAGCGKEWETGQKAIPVKESKDKNRIDV